MNEHFLKFVNKTNSCWLWIGNRKANNRYGGYRPPKSKKTVLAHRFSYELFVGQIQEGMTIDHQCRNTLCVNPEHLKVMSLRDNLALGNNVCMANSRKTRCLNEHEFTKENTYLTPKGRHCKECQKERKRKWKSRQK